MKVPGWMDLTAKVLYVGCDNHRLSTIGSLDYLIN